MSLPKETTRASRRLSSNVVAPSGQKTSEKPLQKSNLAVNDNAEDSSNVSRSENAEIAPVVASAPSLPPPPPLSTSIVPPVQFGDKVFHEVLAKFREGVVNKPICGKEFESTEWHDVASFPEVGSFIACHGSNLYDPRLTFCKLFDNAGIIHMEHHSQRKKSKTNASSIVS
jgi:hypothetical protein